MPPSVTRARGGQALPVKDHRGARNGDRGARAQRKQVSVHKTDANKLDSALQSGVDEAREKNDREQDRCV